MRDGRTRDGEWRTRDGGVESERRGSRELEVGEWRVGEQEMGEWRVRDEDTGLKSGTKRTTTFNSQSPDSLHRSYL